MAKSDTNKNPAKGDVQEPGRRDFIVVATYAMAGLGAAAVAWPLIDQLNPAADTLALANIEVDISKIAVGQSITVKWRGKPVFARHLTPEEITDAKKVDVSTLRDPQKLEDRTKPGNERWLITLGVCTHLGCVPLGAAEGENKGEFGGYFCPCHGSHYDVAGRSRKGPAPKNLMVPEYEFTSDAVIRVG